MTSFSGTRFAGPAIFNRSMFYSGAKFQSAHFAADASFVRTVIDASAVFRNVHFAGDAEFRFCRIGNADFGNANNMTLFAKRADFRGCRIGTAIFDYVDFRGEVSFVNARFGPGGASFRHANLGSKIANFDGVESSGPLVFEKAYLPALLLYWEDTREPLLLGDPDTKILSVIQARLKALGQNDGALDAFYYLSQRKHQRIVGQPLPPLRTRPWAFLDELGRRIVSYGEWILWGWPTGYGTRLGRIVLLSLLCWLFAAVPMTFGKQILARIRLKDANGKKGEPDQQPRSYEPIPPEKLAAEPCYPASLWERHALALRFSFRLMFKMGASGVAFVPGEASRKTLSLWKRYFRFLWHVGALLIVLAGLTLANT
ncbi:MAG TPA: pentapeptide repeat-containing protein, partial [Chromatiaceae bacterium]|nr:pentapeptide repeat-containing protein [Chromatiaceae bacterium]